jgi:3-(3-hydroxy-phenyl)propionate hydroxylase
MSNGSAVSKARVAIVGAGPVGLTMALELARRGLQVVLLETKKELAWSSRAICISRRSLEIFDRLQITGRFFEKALPWNRAKTFHRDAAPVFQLELPEDAQDRFPPFVNIQQYYTEAFLLETLRGLGTSRTEPRWGHRVAGVDSLRDGVRLRIETEESSHTLECEWLIAADGARSSLRTLLNLPLKGTSYEGRYLIADIVIEGAALPVERYVWFDPPSNPGSTVILHVQPDGVWRLDIQVGSDVSEEKVLADDYLRPRIQAHLDLLGIGTPWEIKWRSLYRAHALSLDDYRCGRILFAGDAAHLVPIFGVRGLNSGIDDAHNLGWKLAEVMSGRADDSLLDSYTEERRRAALENLGNAIKSTWFMSPPHRGFRVARDAILELARSESWARDLINPRQSTAHAYLLSSLITTDEWDGGVPPGRVVPSRRLSAPDSHLQRLISGRMLTLLVLSQAETAAQAAVLDSLAERLSIALVRLGKAVNPKDREAIRDVFEGSRFACYLIRPDEYVAARFATVDPEGIEAAVRKVRGMAGAAAEPFIPIEDVPAVVPWTPLETLFNRLAAEFRPAGGEPLDDVERAKAIFLASRG